MSIGGTVIAVPKSFQRRQDDSEDSQCNGDPLRGDYTKSTGLYFESLYSMQV